ncbi:MAG: YkvA family protein [Clostridium sp.]
MNLSGINVNLTGDDLLSIINDFVKIEGLEISKVELGEDIKFIGVFKKAVAINFIGGIKIGKIEDGKIYGEISSFKILNIGILSIFRKLALKYAVKAFEDKGINYESGKVIINIKKIMKDIPFVDFDIDDIFIRNSVLNVGVKSVNISLSGELKKEHIEENNTEEEIENDEVRVISKIEDGYSAGRGYFKEKLPSKAKKVSDYIFIIPDLVALLYRLLKDNRVPMKTKLVISASVAYIAFPTDIIPNNIPFIGTVDELAVIFFALNRIVNDVPSYVLLENWEGKNDIIVALKSIIEYVTNFTGARNVEKIYSVIGELTSL